MRTYKTAIWGLVLLSGTGIAACSGGLDSPTNPSMSGVGGATITGTVQMASAPESAGRLASHTSMSIEICINGTSICALINEDGKFTLSGPEVVGDVELVFRTLDGEVLMTALVTGVGPDEHITVSVDLSERRFRIETRIDGDQASDDDSRDDDSDDDSRDDDSDDDSRDEGPDDDSRDHRSDDDSSIGTAL